MVLQNCKHLFLISSGFYSGTGSVMYMSRLSQFWKSSENCKFILFFFKLNENDSNRASLRENLTIHTDGDHFEDVLCFMSSTSRVKSKHSVLFKGMCKLRDALMSCWRKIMSWNQDSNETSQLGWRLHFTNSSVIKKTCLLSLYA